ADQLDFEVRREIFARASEQVRARVSETTWQSFHRTSVLGHPIAAVAEQLGITLGSVYIARSRVMKRLQDTVQSIEESSDDDL
ncbi:MAG: sigma-70 family RNA polymerase sigma factor, partial [Planctomycetota bacterium]